MDVAARLRGLGLEQYAPAFHDNDVDGEVLPELTADDLISIGVTSVGHPTVLPQLPAVHSVGGSADFDPQRNSTAESRSVILRCRSQQAHKASAQCFL